MKKKSLEKFFKNMMEDNIKKYTPKRKAIEKDMFEEYIARQWDIEEENFKYINKLKK